MKKIKVAQIGTSRYSHGADIIDTLIRLDDVFEIVGYALPENEREKFPERMKNFDGYKELTVDEILNNPEIEAVVIETEEIYLAKYALMCAEAKKHIHMEKPGGLDLEEFEKLIKTVKDNKLVFHTGYMYRYNPVIKKLFKEIENGEFGDIISVEAQMSTPHSNEMKEWFKTFPGGITFFLGCHIIDLVYRIQGAPKKIISLNKSTGINGIDAIDYGMVVFEYENGVSFIKTNSSEFGGFMRRQLVVTGTKKTAEIRPLENFVSENIVTKIRTVSDYGWVSDGETQTSEEFNRYDSMMTSFAQIIRNEKKNEYTYDYELELYKIILKCVN